jgi:NADH:ubiquinone oxidoreductase subunit H
LKKEASTTLRAFLIELPVYAVLVVVYFLLVLHFLGGWLGRLFAQHHVLYAFTALLLLVGQALLLDAVTSLLLGLLRRRKR